MDLCAGEDSACVSTGAARVATHELWTDFLGTCAAAYASVPGACALVHYDDHAAGMRERTIACARELGTARWYVQRGTRCTADTACIAALASAGVRVLRGGQGARARVAPASGAY
jgi:hypothetical protein